MYQGRVANGLRGVTWRGAWDCINPAMLLVGVNLANALLRLGRPSDARTMLERALAFNPDMREASDLLNRIPNK